MKVTRHRDKILEVLKEWSRVHKDSPTLEELCAELEMRPSQKATLQRWLQTMRGIDVEWDDHVPRSLRLLRQDPPLPEVQLPVTETLRYLSTGLAEWEQRDPRKRVPFPEALRLGMSRMYLTSLLQGDNTAPENVPEFFRRAGEPVVGWGPAAEIHNLSEDVTLIEDGSVSDFAHQWRVTGVDVEKQVQEKVLQDVLEYCRGHQLDEQYRAFRELVITRPVMPYREFRALLSKDLLRPLREFLLQVYVDLTDLAAGDSYHFCPRCRYVRRQRPDGSYCCRSQVCERLASEKHLVPPPGLAREEAETYKAITPGVHRYGTIPGLWEIYLSEELSKIGARVTLWPEIDEYDLLVEFGRKIRWAIDVKDWSCLDEERLKKVRCRPDTRETFVVFPDPREASLRLKVRREQLEPSLGGTRLKLMGEILTEARKLQGKKNHA